MCCEDGGTCLFLTKTALGRELSLLQKSWSFRKPDPGFHKMLLGIQSAGSECGRRPPASQASPWSHPIGFGLVCDLL